jgi:hypothetical protein
VRRTGLSAFVIWGLTLSTPCLVRADHLVLRLDGLLTAARSETTPVTSMATDSKAVSSLTASTLALKVSAGTGGNLAISVSQSDLDTALATSDGPQPVLVRLLAPATGTVSEDTSGSVAVAMDTAIVFGNATPGVSRTFDVRIRGSADGNSAYGDDIGIEIEAWRRTDDGKPLENPTTENRSFWGVVPGHFEP